MENEFPVTTNRGNSVQNEFPGFCKWVIVWIMDPLGSTYLQMGNYAEDESPGSTNG